MRALFAQHVSAPMGCSNDRIHLAILAILSVVLDLPP